jgi:hypothetical protein
LALQQTKSQIGSEELPDDELAQHYALLCLFYAAEAGGQNCQAGWTSTSIDPCTWYGTACDSGGRVEKIDLQGCSLGGSIPPEVSMLGNNVLYLRLGRNGLTGSLPTELGNLSNMKILDLGRNQLNGTIPSELGRLTEIEQIVLRSNTFTGSIPTELGRLPNIRSLYLFNNALTGSIPTELGNLKEIDSFELHCNQLNGTIPTELGQLDGLRSLDLSLNDLSGGIPSEIGSITGNYAGVFEFYLSLADNQLTGTLPPEIAIQSSNPDLEYKYVLITGNNIIGDVCQDPVYVIGADCDKVDNSCPCCACCNTDDCRFDSRDTSKSKSNRLSFMVCG